MNEKILREMQRRQVSRTIILGDADNKYVLKYRKVDNVPVAITKFIYRDKEFQADSFAVDIAMKAIENYLLTYDENEDHFFHEREIIRELDRARQFVAEWIPGWFLGRRFRGEDKGQFGIFSDEELSILYSRNDKLSEVDDYLQNGHRFLVQSNTALRLKKEVGGELYKVKLINHLTGRPLDMARSRKRIGELLRCQTGISEVDELYPLGSSASNILQGVFFFMDRELWRGSLEFRGVKDHDIKEIYGDKIFSERPEGVDDLHICEDGKGNQKWFTLADSKFAALLSPADVKRWIAPGSPVQDHHLCLSGIVIQDEDWNKQVDGILAILPETAFLQLLRDSGQESSLRAIQIASPRGKGVIRAVRNETFQKVFGLNPAPYEDRTQKPKGSFKLGEVLGKTLDDLLDEHYLKEVPGSSVIRCVFFEKSIKQDYLIEHKARCTNQECSYSSTALNPDISKCPKCKLPTSQIRYFQLKGTDFGIFKGDKAPKNEDAAVTIQMVTRGNVVKPTILANMLDRLRELRCLMVGIFTPNQLVEDYYFHNNKWHKKQLSFRQKLLQLLNVLEVGWMNTSRGAIALVQSGIHPFHPVVDDRIAEVIARALIEAKRQYHLFPVTHHTDTGETIRIRYGYYIVVPPLNPPADNTIRMPKSLWPLMDSQRRVTLARNPIRVSGSDMATVFVDTEPSYGNVLEVPMSIWSHMQGDYDGDIGIVFPVWSTGVCIQNILRDPDEGKKEGKSKEKPWAVDQVIEHHEAALSAKIGIGLEDTLVTRIYTERMVLGVPFEDSEILYLNDRLQNTILSIKKDVEEGIPVPTVSLKRDIRHNMTYVNPVNVFLHFDPTNTRPVVPLEDADVDDDESYRGIPMIMRQWAREAHVPFPNAPEKSYEWACLLQKFGKWVLEFWPEQNPKLAYRVNNHPYKALVEEFVTLPLHILRKSPLQSSMYKRCFEQLHQEAVNDISVVSPSLMPQLSKLLYSVESAALEYSTKVGNYAEARRDFDAGPTSAKDWKPVKEFYEYVNNTLKTKIEQILGEENLEFRAAWERAVFSYAGTLGNVDGKPVHYSFAFRIAEQHVLRSAFSLYEDMFAEFEGGLDPASLGLVIGHLNQPLP